MTHTPRNRFAAHKAALFAGSALLSILVTSPALAQTATWQGGTSTDWQDTTNWQGGNKPTGATTWTYITVPSTTSVPEINGGTATTNGVFLGSDTGSELNILNGGVLTSGGVIISNSTNGFTPGSVNQSGAASVSGTGSEWNADDFTIGFYGTGTLSVTEGGAISTTQAVGIATQAGSNGTLTVSGEDSSATVTQSLMVGSGGTGTFTVSDGATVTSRSGGIAVNAGSVGTATVTGEGSKWEMETSSLTVGQSGQGTLTVSDGGYVMTGAGLNIGYSNGGTGKLTVTGANSKVVALNASNSYIGVGVSGAGELEILDGGSVTGVTAILGYNAGKTGTLKLDGANSLLEVSNYALLGFNGTGSATVSNGATLKVTGTTGVILALGATGNGTLNIGAAEGSAATGAGIIDAAKIDFRAGTGTLVLNHNTANYTLAPKLVGNGTVKILAGTTTLSGDSSGFTGSTTVDGGTLRVTGQMAGKGLRVASSSGSTGAVVVDGEGANWTVGADRIGVGERGTGTFTVQNGATASSTGAVLGWYNTGNGTATVTGEGSEWLNSGILYVGNEGSGTLNVLDGGKVTSTDGYVGTNNGSGGTVLVDGANSLWELNGAYIGGNDAGATSTATISNGGTIRTVNGTLGNLAGSSATLTVRGDNSLFEAYDNSTPYAGNINVGLFGTGTLNIEQGGDVKAVRIDVGNDTGSVGTLNLSGAGSTVTTTDRIYVGGYGTGTLNLSDGAHIDARGLRIGYRNGADGTLNIGAASGQTAKAAGTITTERIAFGTGTGRLTLNHTTTDLNLGASITGNGQVSVESGITTLSGDNSQFTGATSISGGKLILTNALSGTLTTSGTGALQIGNNTATGSFDNNIVNNGALIFARSDSYTYAGQITGSGAIVQQGGGTTVLSANNSAFTGTSTVSGGTLELTNALGGTIATQSGGTLKLSDGSTFNAAIVNNGTLAFNRTGDYSFAGAISGAGAITKAQTGTLSLTANNSGFTGTTTVAAGTVQLTNALGGSAVTHTGTTLRLNDGAAFNGNVVNNGALVFNRTGDATFSGALSGSGTVTKLQTGTLTLSGNSSGFTGTTTVADGVLNVTNALGGNIANNSTVFLNRTGDYSLSGKMTGTGTFHKYQAGTATYSGNGSGFIGTTSVDEGTFILTGSLGGNALTQNGAVLKLDDGSVFAGDVLNNGTLIFSQEHDVDYDGAISGGGTVVKEDIGLLVLSGDNSQFSGSLIVDEGLAGIGGAFGGDVVVQNNGALQIGEDGEIHGNIHNDTMVMFARSDDYVYDGVISGQGVLVKTEGSDLTLTGDSSGFQGLTVVSDGALALTNKLGGQVMLTDGAAVVVGDGVNDGQLLGDVFNDGLLVFNNVSSHTYSHSLYGTGSVYIGSGTVTFEGDNSLFGGFTLIDRGTLRLDQDLGGYIMNNGSLLLTRDGQYYIDYLNGTGALRKQGAGILTLGQNAADFTGTTYVENGTLKLDGRIGGNVSVATGTALHVADFGNMGNVVNNGTLTFDRTGDYTYSGKLSGTGAIVKAQSGTLTYSGNGSGFTGSTDINAGRILLTGSLGGIVRINAGGTLQVGNGSTDGHLLADAVNNGVLIFDQTGDYNYTGALSGAGGLVKRGNGTLLLSGNYTYTGTTQVDGGLVRLTSQLDEQTDLKIDGGTFDLSDRTQQVAGLSGSSGTLALGNTGSLTVEQEEDSTFGGGISGSGTFTKAGAGRLNLTGESSFTGDVNVNDGTLSVNGTLPGTVGVNSGGTLGGTGTIGQLIVHSGGNMAPGNSIGTLNVNGNVLFEAGSIYTVEVNAQGEADRIDANGQATLQGGTVEVLAENGEYRAQTNYVILDAAGGVSGKFEDLSSNLAFLSPTLSYTANTVVLTMSRNDISLVDVARTPNQIATATAVSAGFADNSDLMVALIGQSENGARRAYDNLSGEAHPSSLSAAAQQSEGLRRTVLGRLDTPLEDGTRMWAEAVGQGGQADATTNTARVSGYLSSGFRMGMDTQANGARLGIAVGVSDSGLNIHDRNAYTDVKTAHVSLYAGYRVNDFVLRGGAAYSDFDFDTRRSVTVGSLSQTLRGNYGGKASQLFAEAGYVMTLDRGAVVEPFIGVNALWLGQDDIREEGGDLALMSKGRDSNHAWSTLGVKTRYSLGDGPSPVIFNLKAGWQHALTNEAIESEMRFVQGGPSFVIQGAPLAKDALLIDGGVDWHLSPSTLLGVGYSGSFANQNEYQSLKVRISTRF